MVNVGPRDALSLLNARCSFFFFLLFRNLPRSPVPFSPLPLQKGYVLRSPLQVLHIGHYAMTDSTRWSDAETIVAVYFCSRHASIRSLRCLLLRRGFDRSENAIESKPLTLLNDSPHLGTSIQIWDASAVDCWIDNLLGDPESVNSLIQMSKAPRFSLLESEGLFNSRKNQSLIAILRELRLLSLRFNRSKWKIEV